MLVTQLCPNLWDSVDCSTPGSSVLHYLPADRSSLKLMSIELVMLSKHLILCRPLLLPPSIFPSVRVFSRKSALGIRWPKYWSFSFSINPSSEYSGLISFRAKVPAAFFSLDFAKNFLHLQQCYKEILLFPPMWGLWKWRQILCLPGSWRWGWLSCKIMSDSLWPLDCNPPGSSVHGILQAKILEWVAIFLFRGSFWPRDWTQFSCIAGRFLIDWATREAQDLNAGK